MYITVFILYKIRVSRTAVKQQMSFIKEKCYSYHTLTMLLWTLQFEQVGVHINDKDISILCKSNKGNDGME